VVAWTKVRDDSYLEVSGHVLDNRPQWPESGNVLGLVTRLLARGMKPTRIDLAWDERKGVLDMEEIADAWEQERYTGLSGPRSAGSPESQRSHVRGKVAETLYFPHEKASRGHVAIYNRQLLLIQRGMDDPGPWVRVELRAKKKRAEQAALWYSARYWSGLVALARYYVEFRELGSGKRKGRWPVAAWWLEFWQYLDISKIDTRLKSVEIPEELKAMRRNEWEQNTVWPHIAREWAARGCSQEWLNTKLSEAVVKESLRDPNAFDPETVKAAKQGRILDASDL